MAYQHVRAWKAMQDSYGDKINQDIAYTIADHMGYDNSPATVSIKTLAQEAKVHYNTADKRTKEMAAAGLIRIEKQGRMLCYSLVGEFDDEQYERKSGGQNDNQGINERLDKLEDDVKVIVKMLKNLHTIVTSPSHDLHTTFTPPVNENVNKVVEVVEVVEEGYPPNPLYDGESVMMAELPPEALPDWDYQRLLGEMVSAIGAVVRDIMAVGVNEKEFNGIAVALIKRGISPEKIRGFDSWWQECGWYDDGGKASLIHFLGSVDDYLAGVNKRSKKSKKPNRLTEQPQYIGGAL